MLFLTRPFCKNILLLKAFRTLKTFRIPLIHFPNKPRQNNYLFQMSLKNSFNWIK